MRLPKSRRFDVGSLHIDNQDPFSWPAADFGKLIQRALRIAAEIEPFQLEGRELLAS